MRAKVMATLAALAIGAWGGGSAWASGVSDRLVRAAFECQMSEVEAIVAAKTELTESGRSVAFPQTGNVVIYLPAIHEAAGVGCLEAVKAFIKAGVYPNLPAPLWAMFTPLYLAAHQGKVDVIKYLLEVGALPIIRDENDNIIVNALEAAAQNGNPAAIKILSDVLDKSPQVDHVLLTKGVSLAGDLTTTLLTVTGENGTTEVRLAEVESIKIEGGSVTGGDVVKLRQGATLTGLVGPETLSFRSAIGQNLTLHRKQIKDLVTRSRVDAGKLHQAMEGQRTRTNLAKGQP
jgi:hypothetical protein